MDGQRLLDISIIMAESRKEFSGTIGYSLYHSFNSGIFIGVAGLQKEKFVNEYHIIYVEKRSTELLNSTMEDKISYIEGKE